MIRSDKILRTALLTFLGSWFAYKLYQTAHEDFFLDGIILLFVAVVGLIVFIWTVRKDSKDYGASKEFISYLPTSIGSLFILANIGLFLYQDSKLNSPTLIRGFYDGGFNGFSVDFKMDGSYVMANGSGLGQSYFYGKYSLNDSIITIDKSNIDNCIKTNTLVIRTQQYYLPLDTVSKGDKANYITQIDQQGKEVDNEMRFRVTEDNRGEKEKNK